MTDWLLNVSQLRQKEETFSQRQNPEGFSAESCQAPMFLIAGGHLDGVPEDPLVPREIK